MAGEMLSASIGAFPGIIETMSVTVLVSLFLFHLRAVSDRRRRVGRRSAWQSVYNRCKVFASQCCLCAVEKGLVEQPNDLMECDFNDRLKKITRRQSGVPEWRPPQIVDGFAGCVGNTPLIYLRTLSEATGCTILGKAEFLNPGGSSKDRIARQIVREAQARGALPREGGTIVEGTSGSTGISLSLMAAASGCNCNITMNDDMAKEKSDLMSLFGAEVERVRPAAISNDRHYSNIAAQKASVIDGGFYTDQFENLSNVHAHMSTTGREIWQQTGGQLDAFVMSAGTGGTITGVGTYLHSQDPSVKVFLADPAGSVLYHRVKDGVAYAPQQAEQKLKRVRIDTITEGIGIDRLTRNFTEHEECISDALRIHDQEAVNMSWHLLRKEGLFVGR